MNNTVCFITCVNNENEYSKCLQHINSLSIPEGVLCETLAIRGAKSITSAYNYAMQKSKAKIKVYLHQDTFIINNNFVFDIVEIYSSNPKIGVIGVVGAALIPITGVWSQSPYKYGHIIDSARDNVLREYNFNNIDGAYQIVKCVDGLIMITQYDIPWRQDIFDGWHFYDISQCMEYYRHGYQVCVPNQNAPWCIHDCGKLSFKDYDKYRYIFLKEYSKNLFKFNYSIVFWVNFIIDAIKKINKIIRPIMKKIEMIVKGI